MRLRSARLGVLALLCAVRPVRAQTSAAESAPVIATVQRLFDAMAQRDTGTVRRLLLPGTRFVALPSDSAASRPRVQTDTAFLHLLASRPERFLERMWAPVVQVHGAIATLWAPYDFHRDGRWSHCGIDTATLFRTESGWQIATLAYTVQQTGCAPSPLGEPK